MAFRPQNTNPDTAGQDYIPHGHFVPIVPLAFIPLWASLVTLLSQKRVRHPPGWCLEQSRASPTAQGSQLCPGVETKNKCRLAIPGLYTLLELFHNSC